MSDDNKGYTITPYPRVRPFYIDTFAIRERKHMVHGLIEVDITLPFHTLVVTLGGIAEKPSVINGQIEIREFLNVTLSFYHDIIDGGPATRFIQRFKDLIENGYSLIEESTTSKLGTERET